MRLIGVDVGGTFTDLVYADTEAGRTGVHKISTTPDDPSRGVVAGLAALKLAVQFCKQFRIGRRGSQGLASFWRTRRMSHNRKG